MFHNAMEEQIKLELSVSLEPEVILTITHEEECIENVSCEDDGSANEESDWQRSVKFAQMKVDSQNNTSVGNIEKQKCEQRNCSQLTAESSLPGPSTIQSLNTTGKVKDKCQSSGRSHVCQICGKGFGLRSNLKQHMLVHTGIKPHVCSECGKGFTQLSNLKTHYIVHTGEKPHVCRFCGKAYTSLHNLKAHEYIHTGEKKRHICDTCGQGFYQLGDLKTHILIHTGQKPHVCAVCGKGFIKRGDLNVHMVVHTGEKPHACEFCTKRFAQKWKLMKHSMVHNKRLTGEIAK